MLLKKLCLARVLECSTLHSVEANGAHDNIMQFIKVCTTNRIAAYFERRSWTTLSQCMPH